MDTFVHSRKRIGNNKMKTHHGTWDLIFLLPCRQIPTTNPRHLHTKYNFEKPCVSKIT